MQFIQVQGNRRPFGQHVIEAHRLLKNSVDRDNYALISKELANDSELPINYSSKVYQFREGKNLYDGKEVEYIYSLIDIEKLNLNSFSQAKKVGFNHAPNIVLENQFPIAAESLLEYITNYTYRHHWIKGVDKFEYNTNEVTQLGTEHVCYQRQTYKFCDCDQKLRTRTIGLRGINIKCTYGKRTLPIL